MVLFFHFLWDYFSSFCLAFDLKMLTSKFFIDVDEIGNPRAIDPNIMVLEIALAWYLFLLVLFDHKDPSYGH